MTLIPARFRPCSRPLPWLRPAPPRRNIRNAPSTWWCLSPQAGRRTTWRARSPKPCVRRWARLSWSKQGRGRWHHRHHQVARAQPDGYSVLLMHAGFSTAPRCTRTPATIPQELRAHRPGGRCADDHHRPFRLPAQQHPRAGRVRQKNKDKVSLANAGIGAASHLCGTMLVEALGVQLLTIPYKGHGPGDERSARQTGGSALRPDHQHHPADQCRLGQGLRRHQPATRAHAVKLPTMDESGFKGFEVGIWHGMWVPKGTPSPWSTSSSKPAGRPGRPQVPGPHEAAGRHGADQRRHPQALDAKVKQQVPQWAELFKKAGVEQQ